MVEIDFAGLYQLQHRGRGEHFVHGADAELRVELVRNFLFAVGHTINGGEYRLPIFRNQDRSGKMAVSSSLVEVRAKGLEPLRLRHAGDGKIGGGRNGAKFDLFDNVRLLGIYVHDDSCKLVGIALLQNGRTLRGGALTGFLKIEPAGLLAETHFTVNVRCASGEIFLQERKKGGSVAAVESGQPRGKLMGRGCIGKMRLREQAAGDQEDYSGQSKLSRGFHAPTIVSSRFSCCRRTPRKTRYYPLFHNDQTSCASIKLTPVEAPNLARSKRLDGQHGIQ